MGDTKKTSSALSTEMEKEVIHHKNGKSSKLSYKIQTTISYIETAATEVEDT